MMLIESTDDLYWDGEGFGPRQVAHSFSVLEDLPLVIEDNRGTTLFLQILNDVLPVICYHSMGEVVGAWVIPDDNVSLVGDSGISCPNCKDDNMVLYQSGHNRLWVCLCGYTEECK